MSRNYIRGHSPHSEPVARTINIAGLNTLQSKVYQCTTPGCGIATYNPDGVCAVCDFNRQVGIVAPKKRSK